MCPSWTQIMRRPPCGNRRWPAAGRTLLPRNNPPAPRTHGSPGGWHPKARPPGRAFYITARWYFIISLEALPLYQQ